MLRDLTPQKDPKGGSPKSPTGGIPVREYEDMYPRGNMDVGGTIWKMATSLLAGLVVGLVVAWFTALQTKGVTRTDMEDYVSKYSPYSQDQKSISEHNATQDRAIGVLEGKMERMSDRLSKMDEKHVSYESDFVELKQKLGLITNYIEEEKRPKR